MGKKFGVARSGMPRYAADGSISPERAQRRRLRELLGVGAAVLDPLIMQGLTDDEIVRRLSGRTQEKVNIGSKGPSDAESSPPPAPTPDREKYVREADRLLAHGHVRRPQGVSTPQVVQGVTTLYYRDPSVRAWTLRRAGGRCELCTSVPFMKDDRQPYLELHHLVRLADGGPDTPDNTTALCANCHRQLHLGADRESLRERLVTLIRDKESGLSSDA